MTVDLKPTKPYRATRAAWETIRENFGGETCWVCGERPWDSLHHLLPKDGAGTWPRGDDLTVNLIPLCGSGTTGCHGLVEARDPYARSQIRGALTFSHLSYLVFRLGGKDKAEAFLTRHYPLADEPC